MLPAVDPIHLLFFSGLLLVAAGFDLRWRLVPNWLNVGLACLGLSARLLHPSMSPLWSVAWGGVGLAVGLALLLYPFARGFIAGGDVKLLAAAGAWLGPLLVVFAALVASVFGGGLALVYFLRSPAAVRKDIVENLRLSYLGRRIPTADERPANLSPPYAVAISIGAIVVGGLHQFGLLGRLGMLMGMK